MSFIVSTYYELLHACVLFSCYVRKIFSISDVSAMSCKNCDGSVLSSQFPYNNDCFDNPELVDSCIYGDYCSTQLISKDGKMYKFVCFAQKNNSYTETLF